MTYNGLAFVYVAMCSGPEDILKVGLSHDPVSRWSAFHRRWFEAFDLDHSLLIQTETRRDAQKLETALHRLLKEHNCVAPLTMRSQFGGDTEWYRGANRAVLDFARSASEMGYVVHQPARAWFSHAMAQRSDLLVTLVDQALDEATNGVLAPGQYEALNDLVDAHRAFDESVGDRLPEEWFLLGSEVGAVGYAQSRHEE